MDWDEHALHWDEDPAVQTYARAAFETLGTLLEQRGLGLDGLRALDFGCGTGLMTEMLASRCREIVALDPAPKMVAVLRGKINANGWQHVHAIEGTLDSALAQRNACFDAMFDLVVCSSVLAFVADYPSMVRRLVSLLAPGGVFLQLDWERPEDGDEGAAGPGGLSRVEMHTALHQAGLVAVRVDIGFERTVGEFVMAPLAAIGQAPPE